jgi:hypothetical protein
MRRALFVRQTGNGRQPIGYTKKTGVIMTKSKSTIALVSFIAGAGTAFAQSNDIATGNMHMDVKAMDTNGDHMISRAEFSAPLVRPDQARRG